MAPDPLSAAGISNAIAQLLPSGPDSGLATSYEAVALTSHACMSQLDFKLRGLDEDHNLESNDGDGSDNNNDNILPSAWNARSASNSFSFRYSHPQSAMQYILKVSRLGKKALIHGVGLGDDRTASCEVVVDDFIAERPSFTKAMATALPSDFRTKVFFSSSRLTTFVELFKTSIIQRLIPGLHKDGYQESTPPSSTITTQNPEPSQQRTPTDPHPRNPQPSPPAPARPYPFIDPLASAPRRPHPVPDFLPPDFEDEHQLQPAASRFNPQYPTIPGRHPLSIGEDDLHPPGLGPYDPLRIGPGGLPRPGGLGGGMYPSFGGPSPHGGEGDGDAPPGARWYPVGPGGAPGRGGRGSGNPFGGFGGGNFI